MWNPFRKKTLLSEENEAFQIETYRWLLKNFGGDNFYEDAELILPTEEFFPVKLEKTEKVAHHIFKLVKKYAGLGDWPCVLKAQEKDPNLRVSTLLSLQNMEQNPLGTFSTNENDEVIITYNPHLTSNPTQMVATLSHELSHYLTSTSPEPPPGGWENWEFATDITATFLGFGIFQANSAFNFRQFSEAGSHGWQTSGNGYLSEAEHSYALAVFIKLKNITPEVVYPHCDVNIKAYVKKALVELEENNYIKQLRGVKYESVFSIKLPKRLDERLSSAFEGTLYSLEMLNDDISPKEYVFKILLDCFKYDEFKATDIMLEIQETGSSQITTGSKNILLDVASYIETDAKNRKYPLSFKISLVK